LYKVLPVNKTTFTTGIDALHQDIMIMKIGIQFPFYDLICMNGLLLQTLCRSVFIMICVSN